MNFYTTPGVSQTLTLHQFLHPTYYTLCPIIEITINKIFFQLNLSIKYYLKYPLSTSYKPLSSHPRAPLIQIFLNITILPHITIIITRNNYFLPHCSFAHLINDPPINTLSKAHFSLLILLLTPAALLHQILLNITDLPYTTIIKTHKNNVLHPISFISNTHQSFLLNQR